MPFDILTMVLPVYSYEEFLFRILDSSIIEQWTGLVYNLFNGVNHLLMMIPFYLDSKVSLFIYRKSACFFLTSGNDFKVSILTRYLVICARNSCSMQYYQRYLFTSCNINLSPMTFPVK